MPDEPWTTVIAYSDRISAEAVLGLFTSEQLPCVIASTDHIPGLASDYSVRVPSRLLHRARWILAQSHVSDAELTYLATGELPDASSDK